MPDIRMLLTGLIHCLGRTTVHRLGRMVAALLSMTGRVTMLAWIFVSSNRTPILAQQMH
jgi:hypothetical protein